jgi:glycosyltransferase involved in cell wall biosynthesis
VPEFGAKEADDVDPALRGAPVVLVHVHRAKPRASAAVQFARQMATASVQSERRGAVESVAGPEFSIVMPCLNEAATLGTCIRKAQRSLDELGVDGEIVVADNGSTDGSRELAGELGARVVPVAARGYGNALAHGIDAARGRYVIMGDADDSYDFSRLGPFVERLRAGCDLVVGNRFKGGIEPRSMPFLHKFLGNPMLSFIGRRLFGTACGDIYCGLRGFDRDKIRALDLHAGGMEYAIEMVVKATLADLRVAEVPTVLSPDGRGRPPHLNTWRDGWRSLKLLMVYSPRWLFLYPGLVLLAIGIGARAWLLPAERTIGGITFDVSTLVYAGLATVVGLQSIYFFVTARWFAIADGLLPDDPRLRRLFRILTPDVGLVLGAALLVAGLGISIGSVWIWHRHGFGKLDYPHVLRFVIPGSVLIACGVQTMLSSLFLSLLQLKRS